MPERLDHAALRWSRPLSARLTRELAGVMGERACDPGVLRPPLDVIPPPPPRQPMDPEATTSSEVAWFLEEHQFAVER